MIIQRLNIKGQGSNSKYLAVVCSKHGAWDRSPNTTIYRGYGCPKCLNKSEGRIAELSI